jgi:hypothetical protein
LFEWLYWGFVDEDEVEKDKEKAVVGLRKWEKREAVWERIMVVIIITGKCESRKLGEARRKDGREGGNEKKFERG